MDQVYWSPGMTLEMLEQIVIERAYKFYQKNKTSTANALGISIRTLDNKLEKYYEQEKNQEQDDANRRAEREAQLLRARGIGAQFDNAATPRFEAYTRSHVESVANVAAQPTVPVPERPQVQEVLPRQASSSGSRKGR